MSRTFYTLILLLGAVAVIGAYGFHLSFAYNELAYPCARPVAYKLGDIDDRFELTRPDALRALRAAEDLWEEDLGSNLFTYDQNADLTVVFHYDERQSRTQLSQQTEGEIALKDDEYHTQKDVLAALRKKHQTALANFKVKEVSFTSDLEAHNKKVKKFNKQDDNDEDDFDELEDKKEILDDTREVLVRELAGVNSIVDEINRASQKLNTLADEANAKVEFYNDIHAEGGVFDQGVYDVDTITIYQYESKEDLMQVLAHELGHARGAPHVPDKTAIMHATNHQQGDGIYTIKQQDREVIRQVCNPSVTFGDTLGK